MNLGARKNHNRIRMINKIRTVSSWNVTGPRESYCSISTFLTWSFRFRFLRLAINVNVFSKHFESYLPVVLGIGDWSFSIVGSGPWQTDCLQFFQDTAAFKRFWESDVPELEPAPTHEQVDQHWQRCILHPAGEINWISLVFRQESLENQIGPWNKG